MQNALPTRQQTDPAYRWKLEDIFANDTLWEEAFAQTGEKIKTLSALSGTLTESAEALHRALTAVSETGLAVERLYVYAHMRKDEDNGNTHYQALTDRAAMLNVEFFSALSFFDPELIAAKDKVLEYVASYAPLANYAHYLELTLRRADHTLSPAEEKLLAMAADMADTPDNLYTVLTNAELQFPAVKDSKGEEVMLSQGRFIPLLESEDRTLRENAYMAYYGTYGSLIKTISTAYAGSVKKDIFFARARKFSSALEASLYDDAVDTSVYTSLIEAVHRNLPALQRYVRLKKRCLGVEEMRMWDIYRPIVNDAEQKIPYAEACEMVCSGLAPLGEEYVSTLRRGLQSGWVDVYENQGKTSGAYSWGVWGCHPYVLMNWNDTLDNTFTLAHELGHAMHSYLSDTHQEYHNAQYPIILAEVASTTNEVILMEGLLAKTEDKALRMTLLNYLLEQIRTTVIRQTMFAEFEMKTHEAAERGESLTSESLSAIYRELNALYYGPDIVTDDQIAQEWARIPHFYNAFYVYKYALGFSSALALAQMVIHEGEAGRDRYLNFLSSGCSDYPLELLARAGVDLRKPDAVAACLNRFGEMVDELEKLLFS